MQCIVSSFEEMIGMYGTPGFIESTLIPFRDQIITDGLVKAMPIHIGPNMKSSFIDEYLAAKKAGNVITSLTEDIYRKICENEKKREEDKQRENVVQFPMNREQWDDDEDEDYDDEDDDFYPDDLPEENHGYMMMFQKDLAASNLTSQTINHHLENADLFLNEYLWGWEEEHMEDGIARIDSFFMDYFIDQWPWASQTSIRQTAASIKKFYRSMLNHGKVSEDEYQLVGKTIQCRKEKWVEELRRRNEEDDDF